MELLEIRTLLELPALRILRGPNAAMVLGFLHRAFKRHLRVAIPESELQAALGSYLEPFQGERAMEVLSPQRISGLNGSTPTTASYASTTATTANRSTS